MDKLGNIYALDEAEKAALIADLREHSTDEEREKTSRLREDVARLDGYLKARAEVDASKRGQGANKDLAG